MFPRCKATCPIKALPLGDFLAGVKNGSWRPEVERIRAANNTGKEEANRLKVELLPVLKTSGTFSGSTAADLLKHSGVLCVDFDDVGEGLHALRDSLSVDPHVLAYFRSPRGNGLKVFVPVNATNADEHRHCAQSAHNHFRPLVPEGAKLDTAPSNVSANCFVSWDADLWQATLPREVFLPTLSPCKEEKKEEAISEGSEEAAVSEVSAVSTVSVSQCEEARASRAAAEARLEALKKGEPHMKLIFEKYLANRPVTRGARFEFLQKAVPCLFNVVAPVVLVELLLLHYDLQTGIWTTSRIDHEAEIRSMLAAYGAGYVRTLSPAAREQYQRLKGEETFAVFRICRDLAKKDRSFFLSYGCLGLRVGIHRQQAQRIMNGLYADGTIDLIERGSVRTGGQSSKATLWKWMLS